MTYAHTEEDWLKVKFERFSGNRVSYMPWWGVGHVLLKFGFIISTIWPYGDSSFQLHRCQVSPSFDLLISKRHLRLLYLSDLGRNQFLHQGLHWTKLGFNDTTPLNVRVYVTTLSGRIHLTPWSFVSQEVSPTCNMIRWHSHSKSWASDFRSSLI